jgi:glycosyltransferase involved in cell wall biosynthesis
VLFAGRIERSKGVFDLLNIARRFAAVGRTDVVFDLCGSGSALDELRRAVNESGVSATFNMHGHCDRQTMKGMFEKCHAVIVPTTTQFVEGFNQVVVEAVLAGRPVITSEVCPALEYVRDAVVEVPSDDVDAYHLAILNLMDDDALYERKCAACPGLQAQFYDISLGWAAALRAALRLLPGHER